MSKVPGWSVVLVLLMFVDYAQDRVGYFMLLATLVESASRIIWKTSHLRPSPQPMCECETDSHRYQ
jgi:hypothetical protein